MSFNHYAGAPASGRQERPGGRVQADGQQEEETQTERDKDTAEDRGGEVVGPPEARGLRSRAGSQLRRDSASSASPSVSSEERQHKRKTTTDRRTFQNSGPRRSAVKPDVQDVFSTHVVRHRAGFTLRRTDRFWSSGPARSVNLPSSSTMHSFGRRKAHKVTTQKRRLSSGMGEAFLDSLQQIKKGTYHGEFKLRRHTVVLHALRPCSRVSFPTFLSDLHGAQAAGAQLAQSLQLDGQAVAVPTGDVVDLPPAQHLKAVSDIFQDLDQEYKSAKPHSCRKEAIIHIVHVTKQYVIAIKLSVAVPARDCETVVQVCTRTKRATRESYLLDLELSVQQLLSGQPHGELGPREEHRVSVQPRGSPGLCGLSAGFTGTFNMTAAGAQGESPVEEAASPV
ncbi:hypothetical protein EYF80_024299 [Liparis tanakae]|uniref:Uncharacterized protein n=1 Tax=Liparis tanakae TaxID=230148 RepID=A0A4Z2HIV8_9TELE|nr:hypothetical protein EYF80_024299 [Liparis tanakae]